MGILQSFISLHCIPCSKLASIVSKCAFNSKRRTFSKKERYKFQPVMDFESGILMHARCHGFAILALLIYSVYFPYEEAATLNSGWMMKTVVRDLVTMVIIYGGWDWILYGNSSPWKQDFKPYKFNSIYPKDSQFYRDVLGTTSSTLISSAVQIYGLNYLYSKNIMYDAWESLWYSVLMIETFPYLRQIYYYWTHRMIHPWKMKSVPDLGYYLYKYVHYYHHKSYLPTPWNGLSLHPVEGFINVAVVLLYLPVAAYIPFHPFVIMALKYDIALSGAGVHDGFAKPGLGKAFHQIHHEYFDYNYGDNLIPFDKYFGTLKTIRE